MTRLRKSILVLLALMVVGLVLVIRRPSGTPAAPLPERTSAPPPQTTKAVATAGTLATLSVTPKKRDLAGGGTWPVDGAVRQRIERALATGDMLEWVPALTDLLNPIYKREDVLAILAGLLKHSNWDVRARAADLLLQLGSYEGVPVLQAALRDAAEGKNISELAVATAASRLHLYRQAIDSQSLFLAYQRFGTPELLNVVLMQQIPELGDLVRKRWASNLEGYDTARMAAFAGLRDETAIAYFNRALTADPRTQLLAHWALYQATGQGTHLDQIIAAARESAGLDPKSESSWRITKADSFDLLGITFAPKATEAMQEIADYAATKSGDMDAFGRTFTALFYLHHDYAFIDQRLLAFFQGQYQGSGIDRGLMMRVAAARAIPEIEAAAKIFNAGAYEQEFVQQHNRPVEQWVDLRNVPVNVVPPLAHAGGKP